MLPRRPTRAALATLAFALAACGGSKPRASEDPLASPVITPAATSPSPVVVEPPSPPAPPPLTRGPATATCVNGWVTPPEGTPDYLQPLGVIRRTTGVEGPLAVVDMRSFQGPESPPSDKGYLLVVRRWYVRLYAEDDPAFRGRFLVEARRFGRGLAAVAPYDTSGFRSPDWIGFQYDSADPEARPYPGLPGLWSGIPYDFVSGGEGLDIPGLPAEVAGCLDGT